MGKGPAATASRLGKDSSSPFSKEPMTIYLSNIILGERKELDILITLEHGVWVNMNTQGPKVS